MFTIAISTLGFFLTMVIVDGLLEEKVDKELCESIANDKYDYTVRDISEDQFIKWSHEYEWVERHNR